jgi:hypothetical protein
MPLLGRSSLHSLGELRDRTFENQFFRASGLNLLDRCRPGKASRSWSGYSRH